MNGAACDTAPLAAPLLATSWAVRLPRCCALRCCLPLLSCHFIAHSMPFELFNHSLTPFHLSVPLHQHPVQPVFLNYPAPPHVPPHHHRTIAPPHHQCHRTRHRGAVVMAEGGLIRIPIRIGICLRHREGWRHRGKIMHACGLRAIQCTQHSRLNVA